MLLVSKNEILNITGYQSVTIRNGKIHVKAANGTVTINKGEQTEAAFEAIKSALKQGKKTLDMDPFDAAEEAPANEPEPEAPADETPAQDSE